MKKHSTKYYILPLLVVLFATPGLAAYLLYHYPSWLSVAKVNKGTLLNPPHALNSLQGRSKWRIIFWSPERCDEDCLQQLDTLARIRLALGRKLYQVDQWILFSDKAPALSQKNQALLHEIDFKIGRLSAAERKPNDLFATAKVFLADPDNYLILSYSSQVNPDDVYKDLKLLLSITKE